LCRPAALASPALGLVWDFDNRLRGADTNGTPATQEVTFEYDALGRRVARSEAGNNVVYVHAGQQVIADYARGAAAAAPSFRYVYGSYVDEPLLRHAGTGTTLPTSGTAALYYHRNQQYSIVGLSDAAGTLVERYAYTAYGELTILAPNRTARATSSFQNRYTYTGREWDPTLRLYYLRARWLEPKAGRFIGRDPLGYIDGMGLYGAYFAVRGVDPSGADWLQLNKTIWGCSGEDCLLADLVKLVDPQLSDKNISCIKPLSKGMENNDFWKLVRAEMKDKWKEKRGGTCGQYDVSNLVAQGENAISLQIGKDFKNGGYLDSAAGHYRAKFSINPYVAIEDASKEGERPLTSVTLVGHGIAGKPGLYGQGKLMELTVDGWKGTPDYNNWFNANPEAFNEFKTGKNIGDAWEFPSFAAAEKGKRPFGCWFAKNAKVRFAGCNTGFFAKQFASKYLRKTASAYGTTRFVWAGEQGLGFFDTFDPPQPLKPLGGRWSDNADDFNKSEYWKEFFGNN
jgi:RHS repeat-associated protein